MTVEVFAPAKINLTLHVTGRRDDGLHLLDSLVVFANVGDRVTVGAADALSLKVSGAQAADVPAGEQNLMLRAATLLGADRGADLRLDKRLPVAAGIGGGSSDAAATLRALGTLWGVDLPDNAALMQLGADLAV
ncbi:MAG: 4-(cytidine 5'-diphospho)-2-C-methyl-D-erythritol kinase, partial [Paracoccaceae bacterium]